MNENTRTLWAGALERLDAVSKYLSDGVVTTGSNAKRAVQRASRALAAAAEQIAVIRADANLSSEGKRNAAQPIIDKARREAEAARTEVEKVIQAAQAHHKKNSAWPRSEGTDADREARLGNARADLHRLLDNVPASKRSERLAFAARNGTDAIRELLFTERYAESVLWPSLEDSSVDAVEWAHKRSDVIKELHPNGERAAYSVDALDALEQASKQVPLLIQHAADMDTTAAAEGIPGVSASDDS